MPDEDPAAAQLREHGGEISPVKAPCSSQWQFWAPERHRGPRAAPRPPRAATVKGGHTTTSTPRVRRSPSRTVWASSRASACVPCIFQLPTTSGVRIRPRSSSAATPGQHAALEELEERAARGGHVADPVHHAGALHRRDRVPAADHRERAGVRDRPRHRRGARRERRLLEDAHRPVPDDGPGALEGGGELVDGRRADVEPHQIVRDLADGHRARRRAGVQPRRGHHVDGQPDGTPRARARFRMARAAVQPVGLQQRAADGVAQRLEERERHAAADQRARPPGRAGARPGPSLSETLAPPSTAPPGARGARRSGRAPRARRP